MTTCYVGLSVSGHDPAFALVGEDGEILFAEATERFLQDKRAWGAAADHYDHVLSALSRHCPDVRRLVVATSWARSKPVPEAAAAALGDRILALFDPPTARWMAEQQQRAFLYAGLNLPLVARDAAVELRHYDHHLCHAAFACATAPFDEGHCLVLDGEGEVGAVSAYRIEDRRLARSWRSWGPGSLGTLYAFLTLQCGFEWRLGEEWKVMGLAAFGRERPDLVEQLLRLVSVDRGRLRSAAPETWEDVAKRIAPSGRRKGEDVMAAADLAASGQAVYAMLANSIISDLGVLPGENLALSGGCALNSSHNGTIANRFGTACLHVPCAPADDGNAVGAALLAWQTDHPDEPLPRATTSPYLGSRPGRRELDCLSSSGFEITPLSPGGTDPVARLLAEGAILGVMRGRAEFGPRALGNRSILADPRPHDMKQRLNCEVKGREPYRPFAPVVAREAMDEWFEAAQPSPYMSLAQRWRRERAELVPAVVHEDGTGRVQTLGEESNPWLASLLRSFGAITSVPVLLNTSLNVMGKPIAHSVADAMAILSTTGLDALVIEDALVRRPGA